MSNGAPGLWWGLAIGLITTGSALVWRLMRRTRTDNGLPPLAGP